MGLSDAPEHVWNSITLSLYLLILASITLAGFALGHPQAMWVWLVLLLTGWESECKCESCEKTEESASEVLTRQYVNGEITREDMEEKLELVEKSKSELNTATETELSKIKQ